METEKTSSNTLYLPIEGMDSEHCALIIQKGLTSSSDNDSYTVELNNKRVRIQSNDFPTSIAKAVSIIRSLGYDVITEKKYLRFST